MKNPIIEIPSDVEVLDTVRNIPFERDYQISNDLKIITSSPVIVNDNKISAENMFYYADGCPPELDSTDKIKAFQDYMDTIGGWILNSSGKYVKLNKGKGYGSCGANTQRVWKTYGKQFLAQSKETAPATSTATTIFDSPLAEPTKEEKEAKAKKGLFWDKTKKSWQTFKTSPGGKFFIERGLDYLGDRLFGQANPPDTTGDSNIPEAPEEKKSNTIWYVLGGVAVLGVILLVVFNKKEPKA